MKSDDGIFSSFKLNLGQSSEGPLEQLRLLRNVTIGDNLNVPFKIGVKPLAFSVANLTLREAIKEVILCRRHMRLQCIFKCWNPVMSRDRQIVDLRADLAYQNPKVHRLSALVGLSCFRTPLLRRQPLASTAESDSPAP